MKQKFKLGGISQFIDIGDLDKESIVERKQYTFEMKMDETEERTVVANVSTQSPDHDGDLIITDGVDLSIYQKNPVIMFAHQYNELPIGKAKQISVGDGVIQMKMEFATTSKAEDIWQLVKGGFLKACSIGFKVDKYLQKGTTAFSAYVKKNELAIDESVQRIITNFTLIENSITPIPANPLALIQQVSAKSLDLSPKTLKDLNLIELIREVDKVKTEAKEVEEKEVVIVEVPEAEKPEKPEAEKPEEPEEEEVKEVVELMCPECSHVGKAEDFEIVEDPEVDKPVEEVVEEPEVEGASISGTIISEPKSIETEDMGIKAVKGTVIRSGGYDIVDEIKKYNLKRRGKII